MNMFNLGEHILYLANNNKGYIRNNHLQIVIYYTIKDYIQDHGINDYIKSIYDEPLNISRYDVVCLNSQVINLNHLMIIFYVMCLVIQLNLSKTLEQMSIGMMQFIKPAQKHSLLMISNKKKMI